MCLIIFFFNDTTTTVIYTLSLHDALPISTAFCWTEPKITTSPSWVLLSRSTLPTRWKDRKSTRLNSSHSQISYAVFCLKKKKNLDNNFIHQNQSAALQSAIVRTYTETNIH